VQLEYVYYLSVALLIAPVIGLAYLYRKYKHEVKCNIQLHDDMAAAQWDNIKVLHEFNKKKRGLKHEVLRLQLGLECQRVSLWRHLVRLLPNPLDFVDAHKSHWDRNPKNVVTRIHATEKECETLKAEIANLKRETDEHRALIRQSIEKHERLDRLHDENFRLRAQCMGKIVNRCDYIQRLSSWLFSTRYVTDPPERKTPAMLKSDNDEIDIRSAEVEELIVGWKEVREVQNSDLPKYTR
jgi:hypothetical protein